MLVCKGCFGNPRISASARTPYKGKGVRYVGEHVQRKEGKTVQ